MKKNSLKILPGTVLAICLLFSGCRDSSKNNQVAFVDQSEVFSLDKQRNPLLLVVEIRADGKLSLNRIETGTVADFTELSEKLKAIFADREKSGIRQREVVINPQGSVENGDLKKLIENLAKVKAAPIRVIKGDS